MVSHLIKRSYVPLVLSIFLLGQSQAASGWGNFLLYGLAGIAVLIFFFFLTSVADNLLVIESKAVGADKTGANLGLFPRVKDLFGGRKPDYLLEKHVYDLKKGYNLPLDGEPADDVEEANKVTRYAIQPPNFIGLQPIPKMLVAIGDSVKAGEPIFFDKKMDRIKFVAPVSGEIIEVKRGAKRSIVEVIILADKEQVSVKYDLPDLDGDRKELVDFLLESGAWPIFKQRPFNIIADPDVMPRDIFVSTFDSGPLAPDYSMLVKGREKTFQKGLDVLTRLTDGLVYLGLDGRGSEAPSDAYADAEGVEKRYFRGKHPVGNVGVQIHHIHPINGVNKVWTVDVNGVLLLGELFLNGVYDTSRVIGLSGTPLEAPVHVKTYAGANLGELLDGRLTNGVDGNRIISGNVLSGSQREADGFLDFYDAQVTVLTEGDKPELFGWLLPLKARASISPTIPNLAGKIEATTNTHGEKRAFVVTNDYEAVMPMDIYTQQLMKAIMVNDFEGMEGLGIYELVEEDVALAEFACVSKQPLQQILRTGLDVMREQS
ncbi:MAG: Na(+)-translocating NADH-quinone reductase subunit A [Bacteroidota bacterium]